MKENTHTGGITMSEENTEQTTDQTVNSGEEQTDTASEKAEETKTFTQEDVNNIATKEARKAQEKVFKELGIEDFENAKEGLDRKSTRLNSSHVAISYAVFCLKKKRQHQ